MNTRKRNEYAEKENRYRLCCLYHIFCPRRGVSHSPINAKQIQFFSSKEPILKTHFLLERQRLGIAMLFWVLVLILKFYQINGYNHQLMEYDEANTKRECYLQATHQDE